MFTKRRKKSTGFLSLSEMSSVEWTDPDSVSKYIARWFGWPEGVWRAPQERIEQLTSHKGPLIAVCSAVCMKVWHEEAVLVLGTYVCELLPTEFAGTDGDFASHRYGVEAE